jgi:integrase
MIYLPNNCRCSELKVFPKNWNHAGASTAKDWYIYYRFYDLNYKDHPKLKYGLLRVVKGMNCDKRLNERREIVRELLKDELYLLKQECFNPITQQFNHPIQLRFDLDPNTPFIAALKQALTKVKAVRGTIIDMKSVIKGVERAAKQLMVDQVAVSKITRKYIKVILEKCAENNPRWSARRHNVYRTTLISLFRQLISMEAVETNPVRDIEKAREIKKEKIMLSDDQRMMIDQTLKAKQYAFWRFIQIFFHSGARETEILNVKAKDVDLVNQTCKYTVLKGRSIREIRRPIKDIALPWWEELMKDCSPDQYVFSAGLIPGEKSIRPEQVTRRWRLHVKKKLGIKADFYSLKHLNTTETMDHLNYMAAGRAEDEMARFNGHTSSAMVVKIYDVKNKARKDELIKKVSNSFS